MHVETDDMYSECGPCSSRSPVTTINKCATDCSASETLLRVDSNVAAIGYGTEGAAKNLEADTKSAACVEDTCSRKQKLPKLSAKEAANKKIYRRRLFKDEENRSPVLGLRIVPASEVQTATKEDASTPPSISTQSDDTTATTGGQSMMFQCKLCQNSFAEPLQLANHKCVRIKSVQYDCPVCGKSFSCPANLASHRRWHKPKGELEPSTKMAVGKEQERENEQCSTDTRVSGGGMPAKDRKEATRPCEFGKTAEPVADSDQPQKRRPEFPCAVCKKMFRRRSYLKQHMAIKHQKPSVQHEQPKSIKREEASIPTKQPHKQNAAPIAKITGYPIQEAAMQDFGGLAALAFAAEVHGRMSPREPAPSLSSLPMGKIAPNTNSELNQTAQRSEDSERKRKFPMSSSSTHDSAGKKFALDINVLSKSEARENPVWLPPSPPRSDLSCSPKSSSSDYGDDVIDKAVPLNKPTEVKNESVSMTSTPNQTFARPLATVVPAAARLPAIGYFSAANQANLAMNHFFNLAANNAATQGRKQNVSSTVPFIHHTNPAMLTFQEPFHPYTYHCAQSRPQHPGNSTAVSPAWNTWATHAATAWKNSNQMPLYLPSPVFHIPKS